MDATRAVAVAKVSMVDRQRGANDASTTYTIGVREGVPVTKYYSNWNA